MCDSNLNQEKTTTMRKQADRKVGKVNSNRKLQSTLKKLVFECFDDESNLQILQDKLMHIVNIRYGDEIEKKLRNDEKFRHLFEDHTLQASSSTSSKAYQKLIQNCTPSVKKCIVGCPVLVSSSTPNYIDQQEEKHEEFFVRNISGKSVKECPTKKVNKGTVEKDSQSKKILPKVVERKVIVEYSNNCYFGGHKGNSSGSEKSTEPIIKENDFNNSTLTRIDKTANIREKENNIASPTIKNKLNTHLMKSIKVSDKKKSFGNAVPFIDGNTKNFGKNVENNVKKFRMIKRKPLEHVYDFQITEESAIPMGDAIIENEEESVKRSNEYFLTQKNLRKPMNDIICQNTLNIIKPKKNMKNICKGRLKDSVTAKNNAMKFDTKNEQITRFHQHLQICSVKLPRIHGEHEKEIKVSEIFSISNTKHDDQTKKINTKLKEFMKKKGNEDNDRNFEMEKKDGDTMRKTLDIIRKKNSIQSSVEKYSRVHTNLNVSAVNHSKLNNSAMKPNYDHFNYEGKNKRKGEKLNLTSPRENSRNIIKVTSENSISINPKDKNVYERKLDTIEIFNAKKASKSRSDISLNEEISIFKIEKPKKYPPSSRGSSENIERKLNREDTGNITMEKDGIKNKSEEITKKDNIYNKEFIDLNDELMIKLKSLLFRDEIVDKYKKVYEKKAINIPVVKQENIENEEVPLCKEGNFLEDSLITTKPQFNEEKKDEKNDLCIRKSDIKAIPIKKHSSVVEEETNDIIKKNTLSSDSSVTIGEEIYIMSSKQDESTPKDDKKLEKKQHAIIQRNLQENLDEQKIEVSMNNVDETENKIPLPQKHNEIEYVNIPNYQEEKTKQEMDINNKDNEEGNEDSTKMELDTKMEIETQKGEDKEMDMNNKDNEEGIEYLTKKEHETKTEIESQNDVNTRKNFKVNCTSIMLDEDEIPNSSIIVSDKKQTNIYPETNFNKIGDTQSTNVAPMNNIMEFRNKSKLSQDILVKVIYKKDDKQNITTPQEDLEVKHSKHENTEDKSLGIENKNQIITKEKDLKEIKNQRKRAREGNEEICSPKKYNLRSSSPKTRKKKMRRLFGHTDIVTRSRASL